MSLLQERETTIRWDAETKVAYIWTNDPAMIERMDALCSHRSGSYVCVSKTGQSANYKTNPDLIGFRFPTSEEVLERRRAEARLKDRRSAERRRKAAEEAKMKKDKGRRKNF